MLRDTTIGICILFASSLVAVAAEPAEPKLPLGRETTYFDGPLDADGYVDYAAAINARLGAGVQPAENANAGLWQAFGSAPIEERTREPYFAALGIDMPPADGVYFQTLDAFLKEPIAAERRKTLLELRSRTAERPWTKAEFPEVVEWLVANEPPLAVITEAVRRPKFYEPIIRSRFDGSRMTLLETQLPGVSLWREAGRALVARAMLNLAEGRHDEGCRDLTTCHRLARVVSRGPTLLHVLIGNSIDSMAVAGDVAVLRHDELTPAALEKYAHEFDGLPPLTPPADAFDLWERCSYLDAIQSLHAGGLEAWRRLSVVDGAGDGDESAPTELNRLIKTTDFGPAMRTANAMYDRLAAASRIRSPAERRAEVTRLEEELKALIPPGHLKRLGFVARVMVGDPATRGQAWGDVLTTMLTPALAAVQKSADYAEQRSNNVRLALALATYHRAEGRYPEELQELARKYVAAVPKDLFTDELPRYRRTDDGYVLYSVGADDIRIEMKRSN